MFKIECNCFAVKIDNLRVLDFSKTFNNLHDIIIHRIGSKKKKLGNGVFKILDQYNSGR